jgi:hypothetical protein
MPGLPECRALVGEGVAAGVTQRLRARLQFGVRLQFEARSSSRPLIRAKPAVDVRTPAVSLAKHFTVPVNRTQRSAQLCSIRAGLRADAGPHRTHVPDDASYDKVRFTAGEDRRILQLKFTIASKCLGLGSATSAPHGLTGSAFRGDARGIG